MRLRPVMPSTEHQIQAELCAYLVEHKRPEVMFFAIPNGGLRHIRVAVRLKAEGAMPGAPDLAILLSQGRTAWLELKRAKGRQSVSQKGFQACCNRLGHTYGLARSFDEAVSFLHSVGALKQ